MLDQAHIVAREAMQQSQFLLADVQASYIAIYLSMVFAYTTVAYVAGKQLSRLQVSIATFVYFISSTYVVLTIIGMTIASIEIAKSMSEVFDVDKGRGAIPETMLFIDVVVWPLIMFASLLFMWFVRREQE